MSFSENPYKHVQVNTERWEVECNSCGGAMPMPKGKETTVEEAAQQYQKHVAISHQRTKEDCKDWA